MIELDSFKKINYNPKGLSRHKLCGKCIKCNKEFIYMRVSQFLKNRINKPEKKDLWDTCSKCWLLLNTCLNPEWVEKNKKAQLLIQSTPEQKKKNADGVSKSWTLKRRKKMSKWLKNRWKNDECFKQKVLKNLSWTSFNDGRYYEIMRKSLGTGGLKGSYKGIHYDSILELSFILYCESNNISIKRYDLCGIKYLDENNKERTYIPDFIINNSTIVEIKGYGLYYNKNYKRNICKLNALKEFVKTINFDFRLILEKDKIIKNLYKKARKIHHEIKEKNNNPL